MVAIMAVLFFNKTTFRSEKYVYYSRTSYILLLQYGVNDSLLMSCAVCAFTKKTIKSFKVLEPQIKITNRKLYVFVCSGGFCLS